MDCTDSRFIVRIKIRTLLMASPTPHQHRGGCSTSNWHIVVHWPQATMADSSTSMTRHYSKPLLTLAQ